METSLEQSHKVADILGNRASSELMIEPSRPCYMLQSWVTQACKANEGTLVAWLEFMGDSPVLLDAVCC